MGTLEPQVASDAQTQTVDAFQLVIDALKLNGLDTIYGLPGIPITDLCAGMFLAQGILLALLDREKTGKGQWVHTSLLEAMTFMLDFQASRWLQKGEVPIQGSPRKDRVNLRLGFVGDEYGFSIDLGLPIPSDSAFRHDPEIKRECIWAAPTLRPSSLLVDRRGAVVRVRGDDGEAGTTVNPRQLGRPIMKMSCLRLGG